MEILKNMVMVWVFCIVNINAVNALNTPNKELCDKLYQLYDAAGEDFVSVAMAEIGNNFDECIDAMKVNQQELQEQIDALSYKNVLFSGRGAKNMGLLVGGVVGVLAADIFMHDKLAHVASDIADNLASDKKWLIKRLQDDIAAKRDYDVQAFYALSALRGKGDTIRWASPYYPAESLASQLVHGGISNFSYSAYLTLYQIATKALAIGAAVGGFGLANDIKVMRNAKQQLSERYKKCQKMIELLEKAQ